MYLSHSPPYFRCNRPVCSLRKEPEYLERNQQLHVLFLFSLTLSLFTENNFKNCISSTFFHAALKLNNSAVIVWYDSQCKWWKSLWRHYCGMHNGADGHLDRLQRLVLWLSGLRAVICSDTAGWVCAKSWYFSLNDIGWFCCSVFCTVF